MSDSTMAAAPQLMAEAKIGIPKDPSTMFPTVRPTPTAKLAHTAARDTRLE